MSRGAMTCSESSENLVADLRAELSPAESDALRTHVSTCDPCRRENADVLRLAEALADSTPVLEPSREMWSGIAQAIDREAVSTRTGRGRLLFGLVTVAVAAAAAAVLVVVLLPSSSATLTPLAGEILIDGAPATGTVDLAEGALLATGMGRLAIRSGRDLDLVLAARLVHRGPGRFEVLEGKVLVDVAPGPVEVAFAFPGGSVVVRGTRFQLGVQEEATHVTVFRGEVEIRTKDESTRLRTGQSMTIPRAGTPGVLVPADPWRVRDWCSAPTLVLHANPEALLILLENDTVLPLVAKPFDPAVAAYSLRIEDSAGTLAEMKVQESMVAEGARRPGDPGEITLAPGESYRLRLDPARLGLARGAYRVRAVYHPYGLPDGAWRGVRESETAVLTVR